MDWLQRLLPAHLLQVELELTEPARFRWFHGGALYAWLCALLGFPDEFPAALRPDPVESGRVHYRRGDRYRFGLTALPGGLEWVERMLAGLTRPERVRTGAWETPMPLRDNVRLVGLTDLVGGGVVAAASELQPLDDESLRRIAATWQGRTEARIRLRTPLRVEREKGARGKFLDESSFDLVRFLGQLDLSLRRAACAGTGDRPQQLEPLPTPHDWRVHDRRLLWIDAPRRNREGRVKLLGGVAGSLAFEAPGGIDAEWALHLAAAQFAGVGKSTHFGHGRIRLESADGSAWRMHASPARTLLETAATREVLRQASWDVAERAGAAGIDGVTVEEWLDEPDRIDRLRSEMLDGSYRASELFGTYIPKKSGGARAIAIPTVRDRVAQRAVVRVLRAGLDQLMEDSSHAYRRGLSRRTAAQQIERLRDQGYRWVLETDIEDFFDSVDWDLLDARLQAVLGVEEPLTELIGCWVRAPVSFQGRAIERRRGLPQGAVISPLLANLFLDRFDERMEQAGFRLVRYADDLIVLCRKPEQVEAARAAARDALAELGLDLNESKTRATGFDQGFRYLGYLFCRSVVLDVGRGAEPDPLERASRWPWHPGAEPRPLERSFHSAPDGQGAEAFPMVVLPPPGRVSTGSGALLLQAKDEEVRRVPWSRVAEVSLVGNHHVTAPALREAMRRGIPVHFLSAGGRLQGSLAPGGGAALGDGDVPWKLWLAQASAYEDDERRLEFARSIVKARIRNLRTALSRQEYAGRDVLREQLEQSCSSVERATQLAELRGVEGAAMRAAYRALGELVAPAFEFRGRTRRPPRDPVSAMLSFGQTMLHAHLVTAAQMSGLLPWIGMYHDVRAGHAALASDLQEEFRHLVELLVVRLVRLRQVTADGFEHDPERGVRMNRDTRRLLVLGLEEALAREIRGRGGARPIAYRSLLRRQARRFATYVAKGDPYLPWSAE